MTQISNLDQASERSFFNQEKCINWKPLAKLVCFGKLQTWVNLHGTDITSGKRFLQISIFPRGVQNFSIFQGRNFTRIDFKLWKLKFGCPGAIPINCFKSSGIDASWSSCSQTFFKIAKKSDQLQQLSSIDSFLFLGPKVFPIWSQTSTTHRLRKTK